MVPVRYRTRWRPAAIAKAVERFKGPDYVYPGYAYAPWTELARLLTSLAARPLTTCFRATFDRPAAVRIQGLAIGIDVDDEDYADAIHDKCRRNGLLVSTEGSTVLLLPSLAIDKRTAARGLDILARSI
jgi:adenosylmethionine-8-amino-7-oxononanoate aminotransferase